MTEGGISSHALCCLRAWDTLPMPFRCILAGVSLRGSRAWDTLPVPFRCILAGVSLRGSNVGFCRSCRLCGEHWAVTAPVAQVVEVYKDVPVERPIERVVEVVKEGKTIFMALLLPASLSERRQMHRSLESQRWRFGFAVISC
jgi:hypothetical protein